MSLYTRLLGQDPPFPDGSRSKIRVHDFSAALGELGLGKLTPAQVAAAFKLSPSEQTEAATLAAKMAAPVESLSLASRTAQSLSTTPQIVAVATIEGGGVTGAELRVFLNRTASQTLTYQLADATGGLASPTPIVTVQDTGGTGDKMLQGSATLPTPLDPGLRNLVLRAQASANASPTLLGATVLIRRVNILVAEIFHHACQLGEAGVQGYSTDADLRARLGVP